MRTCVIKRVLPFALTLIIGTALGNLIGQVSPRKDEAKIVPVGNSYRSCAYRSRNTESSRPLLINFKPQARYTEEARRRGVTGIVELRVLFGKDGMVSDIVPFKKLPYGLTEEAIKAARGIKFTPALKGGEPVDTVQFIEFEFDSD